MGTEDGKGDDRLAALERVLEEKEREIGKLRAELQRFRSMIEHAPIAVVQDDEDNRCTYVNQAYCELFSVTPEEAHGGTWGKFIHPDDRAALIPGFAEAKKAGKAYVADCRIIDADGELRWIHAQSVPFYDADGARLGRVGTVTDITDRKLAHASLEETRTELEEDLSTRAAELRKANDELRIFSALFEHAADAIMLASPEGDVLHVNPSYRVLLGGERDVIGAPLVDAMRPVDEAAREALYSALVDGSAYRGVVTLRGADEGPLPAQVDCYVVRAGPEEVLGLATVIRDLTAERRAEEERLALEAKVSESQEALIRELSTPLVPITERVIALPLVGSINEARAQQILETLLAGIGEHAATNAILDITGVSTVDTHAANALIAAAQAARLLGTEVIISGIGPSVARTLVELGADLGRVKTKSTLAAAIAEVLGRTKRSRRS